MSSTKSELIPTIATQHRMTLYPTRSIHLKMSLKAKPILPSIRSPPEPHQNLEPEYSSASHKTFSQMFLRASLEVQAQAGIVAQVKQNSRNILLTLLYDPSRSQRDATQHDREREPQSDETQTQLGLGAPAGPGEDWVIVCG